MNERDKRRRIIELCLEMNATGLNQGTSGNISARHGDSMLITPSGIPYADLTPTMIVSMSLEHDRAEWKGGHKPSSEYHFHRAILREKPDQGAIVHTHSTFATVISIARRDIPACHYMVAAFGGDTVRCADYATFGTPELSANIVRAMVGRTACLLANHGMIACGVDLDKAMWAAVELETLSRQYWHALQLGDMVVLDAAEMARVAERFKSYGPARTGETSRSERAAGGADAVAAPREGEGAGRTAAKRVGRGAGKTAAKRVGGGAGQGEGIRATKPAAKASRHARRGGRRASGKAR